MKRLLALVALALLCVPLAAQTAAAPTSRPHQNFVDNSGAPCALCTLGSYAAGTTTPQATYTDSSEGSENPNPIVLDVAGGANIWVDPDLSYKFILKDALGNTIWTVDNVKSSGGGAVPCSTPYAIQIANSDATALTCDPTITIDPTGHSLLVGGAISGPSFTLKNLGTITDSWTLDVTSPATALSSLGPIPLTDLDTQAADTVVMNASGDALAPTAVALPSGCTNGVNYDSTTHTWSCAATTIPLSSLAPQDPDTVVMNATGASAVPTAVTMPSGCAYGVNYSTATHSWTCQGIAPACVSKIGSRTMGATYQNTTPYTLRVYATYALFGTTYGEGFGIDADIGATSASQSLISSGGVNNSTGQTTIPFEVPPGYYYSTVLDNSFQNNGKTPTLTQWIECVN